MKRLRDAVREAAAGSAAELHGRVFEAVDSFTAGEEQRDDVTLAVIEYHPE
jgi:hypothetical protein